ncbi:acyltransferase family protein [Schlesneria paludicola]|uniref:acyltransferase family protein n=1 Tax=Schlesneria paludicola TaxID=360056 RepID=UPI00029A478E
MIVTIPNKSEIEGPATLELPAGGAAPSRLVSVDAYRGWVMLLMMAEVLRLRDVAKALPESRLWAFLAQQQSHVTWVGCVLHDMIQPSFSFLVGVALPLSLRRRSLSGQPLWQRTAHAAWRSLVLILLGVFLRSTHSTQTRWTFEDTLSQIGLGYLFLYLLSLCSRRAQWAALISILVGYWLFFALYPLPGADFDWAKIKGDPNSPSHLSGFAAHWNLNTNPAWAFDTWFLNLFPRQAPFTHNGGGYSTLNFIPTLATMILGLLAGGVIVSDRSTRFKLIWLVSAGLIGLASGLILDAAGLCPIVKKIWTPSWVLFSGGWCFLILAAWYAVVDVAKWQSWAFVFVVVGMNSIAAYLISHLWDDFIARALKTHLGESLFQIAGAAYQPLLLGAAVLTVEWLILLWMYRRKIFLRV